MKRTEKILVVDDEEAIREGVRDYLELEGFTVATAASAEEALEKIPEGFSLLLLDVMMGGMDGFELARRLRADEATSRLPIIFLTAKDTDDDMVEGLSLGADDYIAKPFSMKVLLARVDALLRRTRAASGESADDEGRATAPAACPVVCDRTALSCRVDGREVKMPRKEFEILALMLDNPGRVFTREELMKMVWPENVVVVDRSVDVHVTRIRSKIAPYGRNLVSRSGYGYGWFDV